MREITLYIPDKVTECGSINCEDCIYYSFGDCQQRYLSDA